MSSWRFRRVFRRGPFRCTFSKRGIGWSFGVPGLRYGVSPNGSHYVSLGIPGTGLYWIKYFDQKQEPLPQKKPTTITHQNSPQNKVEPWWKQKGL